MKISVRVKGDWFAVPVPEPHQQSLKWLGEKALNKYRRLRNELCDCDDLDFCYEIRKAKGGVILDPEDMVADVLDDNDFVSIGTTFDILLFTFKSIAFFCSFRK